MKWELNPPLTDSSFLQSVLVEFSQMSDFNEIAPRTSFEPWCFDTTNNILLNIAKFLLCSHFVLLQASKSRALRKMKVLSLLHFLCLFVFILPVEYQPKAILIGTCQLSSILLARSGLYSVLHGILFWSMSWRELKYQK